MNTNNRYSEKSAIISTKELTEHIVNSTGFQITDMKQCSDQDAYHKASHTNVILRIIFSK
jgi:hypothetical protein